MDKIIATEIPQRQRIRALPKYFGAQLMMRVEGAVFDIMRTLSTDYTGGRWRFYSLSNGGFYMAPANDGKMAISSPNQYDGKMTADAAGIAACLFVYSNLSFQYPDSVLPERYHQLRDFASDHAEWGAIAAATD